MRVLVERLDRAMRRRIASNWLRPLLAVVFLCPSPFVAACKFFPPSFAPACPFGFSSSSSREGCSAEPQRRRRRCDLKFNDAGRRSFFLCRSVVRLPRLPLPKLSRVLARCTSLPVGFGETAVTCGNVTGVVRVLYTGLLPKRLSFKRNGRAAERT